MEDVIKRFLSVFRGRGRGRGDGSGYGDGSGDGSGYGYGSSSGYSYGYGSGDGDGDGSGDGDGDGYGIKEYNGHAVHMIDRIPTILRLVSLDDEDGMNGFAVGRILKRDLSTEKAYVAKREGLFAHGKTLDEAIEAVQEKLMDMLPLEERVAKFLEAFPLVDSFASARELFKWHHTLTGSCLQGRRMFCQEHDIDMDAEYTILQFLDLTKDAYGGDVINFLRERYKELQNQGGINEEKDADNGE